MSAIEFIGLGIALIHLAIAVVALLWPPKELKEKYFHAAYIGSMVIISGIFTYLIFVNHQELASSRARADEVARRLEEKNKISTQADAVAKSLPFNGSETCRAIVLASFAFLEKWKVEFPETLTYTRKLLDKDQDKSSQSDCMRDANSMTAVLKGIASQ